ncbi:MAG TPA: site-2 protease family protein [Nocardioides sp.]
MTALYYALGVIVFVVAILVSIGLHEFGHLIPAKKFGGKVTQWFIGFGPTVWSRRVGETEYGVKGFPLGGYVKIVGMLPPGEGHSAIELDEQGEPVERIRGSSTGLFTQLISDAREAEWEHIRPADSPRLFYKLPWWKKVIVMAGGPTVNILIAFAIFAPLFATYGNPNDVRATTTVSYVAPCVVPVEETGRECTPEDPVTPAYDAGLRSGDVITSFNGTAIGEDDWKVLQREIRANDAGDATIGILRDGRELTIETTTTVALRPVATDAADERDELVQVGFLGVSPDAYLGSGGLLYTLGEMGDMTVRTVEALAELPVKVWGVARAIVGLEERAADSPVSIVGGGRLAGETVAHEGFDPVEKLAFLAMLVAGFNFFIGMFNFVPLLPLDGGHIAGALYEGLRRGVARLRGRPDPGHVDVAKLLPVAYVAGVAMLVMGLVLIVGDLVVPLHIAG